MKFRELRIEEFYGRAFRRIISIGVKRFAALLLAGLLVLWLVTYFTAHTRKASFKESLVGARSLLQAESASLATLPEPQLIEKGQIDSALGYIVESSNKVSDTETASLPPSWQLKLLRPFTSKWYTEIDSIYQKNRLETNKSNMLHHHAEVLSSLKPLLSYNPQADLSSDTLTDEDVSGRIQAAQEGISSVSSNIKKLTSHSENDDLQAILMDLDNLQNKLKDFDRTRDKTAWYQAVDGVQTKIIANRQTFWRAESEKLLASYAEIQQDYSAVINQL